MITANYDDKNKHRTRIGTGSFVSVSTMFVAPVSLGDGAYPAAGSVITNDVPPGALGIARARQTDIEGYTERRRRRTSGEQEPEGGAASQARAGLSSRANREAQRATNRPRSSV